MKISSTTAGVAAAGAARVSGPAAGGFAPAALSAGAEAAATGRAGAVGALSSLEALLALQEAPGSMERRRRSVKRAGRLLDVLEGVKLALLDDAGGGQALDSLRMAVREQRLSTDDPGLEGVLDEIEIRAEVELAKQEVARRAA